MNTFENLNIAVAGTGYVGLSMATLLSQNHQVTAVDVIPEKVEKINNRISPIQDEYIEKFFAEKELNLKATLDGREAYKDADFVIIAAPTNYDPVKNFFDTHHIDIGYLIDCLIFFCKLRTINYLWIAYDNTAWVKVIIECLALTKELRREEEVELLHALLGILQVEVAGVTDRKSTRLNSSHS